MSSPQSKFVALSGGVGGARFADGLAAALPAGALTVIVNTGDDFEHWGLSISPDLDTVMYTLSGLADEARGWGLASETFGALEMVKRYGGEDWFALGDRDLGTHLLRTQALSRGERLGAITERLCRGAGVPATVLPMTDGHCRTMIDTAADGTLSFQDWFVKHRTRPVPVRVWSDGAPAPAPGVLEAIAAADVVLIGPSNPFVSIEPILGLRDVREALGTKQVIAVSPIVHGQAVKGPLAAMIQQLAGRPASAAEVARHYGRLLAGYVVAKGDEADIDGPRVLATDVVMRDRPDRTRLAREVLAFAGTFA
jgi:LPPG:FO 2-phospho-L-lactate transferase